MKGWILRWIVVGMVLVACGEGQEDDAFSQDAQVRLLSSSPSSAHLWKLVASRLMEAGNSEQAIDSYLTASRLDPTDPTHFESIASLLLPPPPPPTPPSALPFLVLAVRRCSTNPSTYYDLANLITSHPPPLSALNVRGDVSLSGGGAIGDAGGGTAGGPTGGRGAAEYGGAVGRYFLVAWLHEVAVELEEGLMEAWNNMGTALLGAANALMEEGLESEASDSYRRALASFARASDLSPEHHTPLWNAVTLGQKIADLRYWDALSARLRNQVRVGGAITASILPWQASVYGLGPSEIRVLAERLAKEVAEAIGSQRAPRGPGWVAFGESLSPRDRRLRVGYLSCSGFMGRTTTANFVRTVFSLADRERVTTVCYARGTPSYDGKEDGSYAQGFIMRHCGEFKNHTQTDVGGTAWGVSSDGVHALVDLTGWTLFPCAEVLALRPAPVQISWHGYGGTLGKGLSDLIAGDPVATPPDLAPHFSERLLLTHGTYLLSARPRGLQPPGSYAPPALASLGKYLRGVGSDLAAWPGQGGGGNRSVEGFEDGDIILCSWNNIHKADPHTLRKWLLLLVRVPRAKLWLMRFDPTPPPNVARVAEEAGVDPRRVVWSTFFPRHSEHAIKSHCRLFLDWPAFNAHTTAAEALWGGVPLLTAPTDEFSGRVAASVVLLGTGGGGATVARGLDDYYRAALALLRGHERDGAGGGLAAERGRLEEMVGGRRMLCGDTWVRSWESAIRRAVDAAMLGSLPMHVTPGPLPAPAPPAGGCSEG